MSNKKQAKKTSDNIERIKEYLQKHGESKTNELVEYLGLSPARTRALLKSMEEIECTN